MALSVDIAAFTFVHGELSLLLVQRAEAPFAGLWALPGGAVLPKEPLGGAALRLLYERAGSTATFLEQLYTFGEPDRDPRGRTLSVAYYALLSSGEPLAGRGVRAVTLAPIDSLPEPLAFDHSRIARYARWRLGQKITYAPLAFAILPEPFTLGDLRLLHEAIEGKRYDRSNFQKQMLVRWDLAPVPGARDRRTRRPARLFRYIGPRDIAGPPDLEEDTP